MTVFNPRQWREWSDAPPPAEASGHVEGEYVDGGGELDYTVLHLFHYADVALWGFGTGDWREGTYKANHPKFHRWRYVGPVVPPPGMQGRAILVWEYDDAPGELKALSRHGGDEDWVALVPVGGTIPSWAESGTRFGCCDVSEHAYWDGRTVLIGAHA